MPTLDWLNRAEALTAADRVPYRVLEPVSEHGDGSPDNLLIQGDNLDALKALLPFYRGRVKCIFIDPPYNTKSAFEHYDDNLEHSQWLSMMYPRLVLLRELLAEDGSIWVTIDDNEGHYLKVLMDEVFGRENFIANLVWEKRTSRENRRVFSFKHDHLLCYARDPAQFAATRNTLPLSAAVIARYKNPDGDPRGEWQSVSANAQAGHATPSQFYKLRLPSGREIDPPKGRCWLYTQERMAEEIAAGNIWFGRNGDSAPRVKKFRRDAEGGGLTPETIWYSGEVSTNDEAKKSLLRLLADASVFDNPKPEALLRRVLMIATSKGDFVLDSFLGSGTTAAVAHKMGRRWIGIEMGEHARTHCLPRLHKVIDGEQGGISQAVDWLGGGGFRFLRLGEPMFDADGHVSAAVRFATLASFIWMQETGTAASGPWTSPQLGVHDGRAIYLLFNGILHDLRPESGNVLTNDVLAAIERVLPHDGPKTVYGEACLLGEVRLAAAGVTFRQLPYAVNAR